MKERQSQAADGRQNNEKCECQHARRQKSGGRQRVNAFAAPAPRIFGPARPLFLVRRRQ
ncbi:MAG TPA: hypothetical protein VGL05_31305 [Kribbella sp.]